MPRFTRPVPAPARKPPSPHFPASQSRRAGPQRGPLWHAIQLKAAQSSSPAPVAKAGNGSGLPAPLKAGVEALSGLAMDDVRVHSNSSAPAKLGALAFTKGSEIHLGPGQEGHLPHEAWHVVQQKQGRVRATAQMKGGIPVNEDAGLEAEADRMGERALAAVPAATGAEPARVGPSPSAGAPMQFLLLKYRPSGEPEGAVKKLHDMAQVLDKATTDGHAQISKELSDIEKGSKFDFGKYESSSSRRINHFYNVLTLGSDSLKAAAAGYMIEDIVTASVSGQQGYTSQYVLSAARPDFLIQATDGKTKASGVVDITSAGQNGHIFNKRFAAGSYDYAAECLYPNLSFGRLDKIPLGEESVQSAREIQIAGANKFVSTHVTGLKKITKMWTESGWTKLSAAATELLMQIDALSKLKELFPESYASVDVGILKFTALVNKATGGSQYAPDTIGEVIETAQAKYALEGHPPSWTPSSKSTMSTTSVTNTVFPTSSSLSTPTSTKQQSSSSSLSSSSFASFSSSSSPSFSSSSSFSSPSSSSASTYSSASIFAPIVSSLSSPSISISSSSQQQQQQQQHQQQQQQQSNSEPMALTD